MFMLGVCYNCVCWGCDISMQVFFSIGCQGKCSQRARISKFLSLSPLHTNTFTCLVRHVISTHFSLSGLESFENTSYTGNCNKGRSVSISACSCLSNGADFLAGLHQVKLAGMS